jgi:hypothetical protein
VSTRLELLNEFHAAPIDSLFPQDTIAALLDCSTANVERARWQGWGIPFVKLAHRVLYRKRDILTWLSQHPPVRTTAEARAQRRLREVPNVAVAASGEG